MEKAFGYKELMREVSTLIFFDEIFSREPLQSLHNLFAAIENLSAAENIGERYSAFYRNLLAALQESSPVAGGNAWQGLLLEQILDADNPISAGLVEGTDPAVQEALTHDCAVIAKLLRFDFAKLEEDVAQILDSVPSVVRLIAAVTPAACPRFNDGQMKEAKQALLNSPAACWGEILNRYYSASGYGIFNKYLAFAWDHNRGLRGIRHLDKIALQDLLGYEEQKEKILRNTLQFLQGLPANNVLLYGDRGTGKSSTVKALLNEYWNAGLRMVELRKEDFPDMLRIIACLRQAPHKFILFIDDLSFEEFETDYKSFKAVLEGSIEGKPENILIYATSNRRHLVKESFAEREEVRGQDTRQEKLSLADRFGIVLTYPSPNQEEYLRIVEKMAEERELQIPKEELRQMAIRWEMWNNGRSGRTARQFIDDLTGRTLLSPVLDYSGGTGREKV